MNKFKKISLFFILPIIVLTIFFLKNIKCTGISCLIFNQKSKFVISDTYEDNSSIFRALYHQNNDVFLRLEVKSNIEEVDASKLLSSKTSHLSDIFENSISPYPGELSVNIACADRYRPKLISSSRWSYFIGYLNDRLQFGSCSEDQIQNQGAIGFLYCPNQKKFFQIEYIVSVEKDEDKAPQIKELMDSLSCKN